MQEPYLIEFQKIGEPDIGFISVAEPRQTVPFQIERAYWVYQTPDEVERGNHAHKNSRQVLIALQGTLHIHLEDQQGTSYDFYVNNANQGLVIPELYWRVLHFKDQAICLCLSSALYDEEDYIRDYIAFKQWKRP